MPVEPCGGRIACAALRPAIGLQRRSAYPPPLSIPVRNPMHPEKQGKFYPFSPSRITARWILPVGVLGNSSMMITLRGAL